MLLSSPNKININDVRNKGKIRLEWKELFYLLDVMFHIDFILHEYIWDIN